MGSEEYHPAKCPIWTLSYAWKVWITPLKSPVKWTFVHKTKLSVITFPLEHFVSKFHRFCSFQKVLLVWETPAASPSKSFISHGKNYIYPFLSLFFFDKIIYENYINLNASHKNSSLGRQMYFKLNRCLFFPRNFSIGKFTSLGIKDTMRLHKLYSTCWLFQTQLSEIFFLLII